MRKIELITANGGYVATVEIPPFPDQSLPQVVMWGDRCFTKSGTHYVDPKQPEKPWSYFECFAVASITPSPGVARWRPIPPPPVDETQRAVSGRAHVIGEPDQTVVASGQHREYVVLTDAERAKGFVRPVRRSYRHLGTDGPQNPLRDLTPEEATRYEPFKYVKYEEYLGRAETDSVLGRFWTQEQLDKVGKGCGSVTTMARDIAETYARSPRFYGSTFCVGCGTHLPVGAEGEFVWEGTNEKVGT
jgi:hypothetical protein